jgi:hypothetical protein
VATASRPARHSAGDDNAFPPTNRSRQRIRQFRQNAGIVFDHEKGHAELPIRLA